MQEDIDNMEGDIEGLSKKIHKVEDEIFSDFCKRVGVKTIRDYEENQLKQIQFQAERRVELNSQKGKLINQ